MKHRHALLLRRIRAVTWCFIIALVISGVTAIPLETEMNWAVRLLGGEGLRAEEATGLLHWFIKIRDGLSITNARYPFLAYGYDWLAFGHIVIAIAFLGALRDPVRHLWLFQFGMIACALIVPWAFIFGEVRGIPLGWRLIDCAFGVIGLIPVWLGWKWTRELATLG